MRSEGLRTPVVMFAGALPEGMADLVGAGLVPTIVDRAGAEAAARAAAGEAGLRSMSRWMPGWGGSACRSRRPRVFLRASPP